MTSAEIENESAEVVQPKRKRGERGKGKNNKRKLVENIINPDKPKRTRRPRDPDYVPIRKEKTIDLSKRSALAQLMGVSTQTLYNREAVFGDTIPDYFVGTGEVRKNGRSLKEFPALTPYQQFIHRQFEELRSKLGQKDCTPNSVLVEQNLEIFNFEYFRRIEAQTVDVEADAAIDVDSETI